jgi:hypothetical protein
VITTNFRDTWDGAGVLNQADHRATGWTVLDAVRDAGNRWVFPELLAEGLEPWDGVTQVWAAGSPDARHGVDITASFAQEVASLRAHEAYLRGLRSGTFDPEAYLAGLDRTDGVRRASGTATDMPMGQPVRCHAPHCPPQWVVRRSRSATLLHLAIDGSGFPAANDEPEDPEVKLVSRFGLLEVLPPAREFIGREDSGLLRFGQVPVEEAMREGAIRAHGMWHTGDFGQPGGVEQAGQAAPDPAVLDAVAERMHDLARCPLIPHVQGVMAVYREFPCNNSSFKGIGNMSSCRPSD